jgi:hypothetical protein
MASIGSIGCHATRFLEHLRSSTPTGLQAAVRIKRTDTAYGQRTIVSIDHRLPEPGRGGHAAFRVTTREQFLPRAHFDRSVRETVNCAAGERGRRIYAIELSSQEIYAHAISNRTNGGGFVDMDAANRPDVIAVLRRLGFRDAPRVSGFSPSGRHLRQDATSRR